MPEEKKKQEKDRYFISEAKTSPPPEPVDALPFRSRQIKKGLTSPPPEPEWVSPFSATKPARSKATKGSSKTEEQ